MAKKVTLNDVLTNGRGIERSFCCPVHNDTNASASVNIVKGVWVCYACKATGGVDDYTPKPEEITKMLLGEVAERTYPEEWLNAFDSYKPSDYWSKRYGLPIAKKHRCGTHYLTGEPTYPIRNRTGELLGVVRRTKAKSKYIYPSGIRTSMTFYGEIKPCAVMVLVEGASDVMALDQSGIPEHWTVLGCFGSGLHSPQVKIIADYSPKLVVAAFDSDFAGDSAIERAKTQLSDIVPVLSHRWSKVGANDPGDLIPEQRVESIRKTIQNSLYKKHA